MSSLTQPIPEDDFQPIHALNDFLFCERRCALHRIEQVWVDNVHTVEGTHGHRRADLDVERETRGVRSVRAVLLRSRRLRLVGKSDVIEFHRAKGDGNLLCEAPAGPFWQKVPVPFFVEGVPYPVEYKRGKRRRWDNDDVQLCAQALCLEEMLGVAVPAGAIFHIRTKRRREVLFDADLRTKTEATARRLHELIASGVTPPPILKPRCRGCSLHDLCMPELLSETRRVTRYARTLWSIEK